MPYFFFRKKKALHRPIHHRIPFFKVSRKNVWGDSLHSIIQLIQKHRFSLSLSLSPPPKPQAISRGQIHQKQSRRGCVNQTINQIRALRKRHPPPPTASDTDVAEKAVNHRRCRTDTAPINSISRASNRTPPPPPYFIHFHLSPNKKYLCMQISRKKIL